jgi:hypothetical protein
MRCMPNLELQCSQRRKGGSVDDVTARVAAGGGRDRAAQSARPKLWRGSQPARSGQQRCGQPPGLRRGDAPTPPGWGATSQPLGQVEQGRRAPA